MNIYELPTQRMRKLALEWSKHSPRTQAEEQAQIRSLLDKRGRGLGGMALTQARDAIGNAAIQAGLSRQHRLDRRIRARLGDMFVHEARYGDEGCGHWKLSQHCIFNAPRAEAGRRAVTLPRGTPASRLDDRRIKSIRDGICQCLHVYARHGNPSVSWVDTLGECACSVHKEEGWLDYGGKRRYGIVSAKHSIHAMHTLPVPRNVGGLLTLGAVRSPEYESESGERVYRAAWVRQGKGFVSVDRGFIAHRGGQYAHGRSVAAARGVLTRRNPAYKAEAAAKIERWRSAVIKALDSGNLNGYDVRVTVKDASRAGLCEPGIMAWVSRNLPGRKLEDGAMVSEILPIKDQHDLVLAACLSAIRRSSH